MIEIFQNRMTKFKILSTFDMWRGVFRFILFCDLPLQAFLTLQRHGTKNVDETETFYQFNIQSIDRFPIFWQISKY